MSAIGIDEVFEAKIVSGPVTSSTSRTIACLRPRSSKTASMTMSTLPNPDQSVAAVTRCIARSASRRLIRLRFVRSAARRET